jgi:hypothetical protein
MKNILSTTPVERKRKSKESFVGGYIPQKLSDYMTLYCYALKTPKNVILLSLVKEWVAKMKKEISLDDLKTELAKTICKSWNCTEGMSYDTFKQKLKIELKLRKLEPEVIEQILNMVEDEKNKAT